MVSHGEAVRRKSCCLSANSKRSSGVRYLETALGVSNAEVGNAHA